MSSHYSAMFCQDSLDHVDASWHKPSGQTPLQIKHPTPLTPHPVAQAHTNDISPPAGQSVLGVRGYFFWNDAWVGKELPHEHQDSGFSTRTT